MLEVYRGSINTWECDEMGHMNVRFYVNRMMEGLAEFVAQAGMPNAFRAPVRSTVRPRDQHIRFLKEARAADPFSMKACVLEVRDSSALIYQQIDHADGRVCAAFRTWVDHIEVDTGLIFPWSPAAQRALEGMKDAPPPENAPRSLDPGIAPRATATMAEADAVGALLIGRGVVPPQHCDIAGRMAPEFVVGRISDSMHLMRSWREKLADAASKSGGQVRAGGAVLEYRVVYRRWPRAGDRFVIRSARGFVNEKLQSFVHWLMDPESGEAWATAQAVSLVFNLDTRKIVSAAPEQVAAFEALAPAGLSL